MVKFVLLPVILPSLVNFFHAPSTLTWQVFFELPNYFIIIFFAGR